MSELNVQFQEEGSYETLCQNHLSLAEELADQLRHVAGELSGDDTVSISFPGEKITVVDVAGEEELLRYTYDADQRKSDTRGLTVEKRRDEQWEEVGDGSEFSHISDFHRLALSCHNAATESRVLHPDGPAWDTTP